ncbi:GNAT family N-acetyltransferase [Streptococcus dentapri]|uniref:GNAT family N-acetyltransferase n=1 Tax=Streptococcus dentapri TaxID=573564 RepID=A0ABV8D0R6_9STRE
MDIWTNLGKFSRLETQRLWLRPFNFEDSNDFYAITHNPDNLAFIFPTQASRSESDYLLVHYFMKEPLGTWAIEDKTSQHMLGAIRFENLNLSKGYAELGYFINQEYWGQGLATESLKTLSFLAFQEFGLKTLSIITHKENIASQRVAQKAGFKLVRQFRGSDRYSHKMRDYLEFHLKAGDQ